MEVTLRPASLACLACLLLALAGGCSQSHGPFPSPEIRLIIQASPGGLSDTVSRVIASRMEPDLGVPVVCENRPGATGAWAFCYESREEPEGSEIGHGPMELAMVRTLGFTIVGPEDVDLLGLAIACTGLDPMIAYPRFTSIRPELHEGIAFLPVMVGLFGLGEVLGQMSEKHCQAGGLSTRIHSVVPSWQD